MKEKLLWGSLIFVAVYMVVPWIMTRVIGIGVFRKGKTAGQIALTFDDGPDPIYTPKLLDLLKKHGVRATFFVLGSKAEKHPDLIRRIHEDGHQIGVHNYTHLSNWLMAPWAVRKRHVIRSADIVEGITGVRPAYYRPPWGIINLFDFRLNSSFRLVMWSHMGRDWNSRIGQTKLRSSLVNGVREGAVILLHDSGETLGADRDAPMHMLAALEDALVEFGRRNWSCVRVDEMAALGADTALSRLSAGKRMLVNVWMLWERCFIKLFNITPVDPENTFLQLRVREYHGSQPMVLEDGEIIRKGDRVAELHLNNDTLFRLGAESRSSMHLAIQMIRRTEKLLPQIRFLLQNDPNYRDVKGLYGITLIHRGPEQLGFTILDLPKGTFSFLTRWYLKLLMYVVHPQGKDRLKTKSELLVPKIIAISKKELMNRYIA